MEACPGMRPLLLLLPCHLLLLQPPCSLATYRMVALQELCRHQQPPKVQRISLEDGGAAIIALGQGEVKCCRHTGLLFVWLFIEPNYLFFLLNTLVCWMVDS